MTKKSSSNFLTILLGIFSSLIATFIWQWISGEKFSLNFFTETQIPLYFFTIYSVSLILLYKLIRYKIEEKERIKESEYFTKLDSIRKECDEEKMKLKKYGDSLEKKINDYKNLENYIIAFIASHSHLSIRDIEFRVKLNAPEFKAEEIRLAIGKLAQRGILISDGRNVNCVMLATDYQSLLKEI